MKRLKNFLVLCSVLLSVSVCATSTENQNLISGKISNLMSEAVSKFKLDLHHSLQSSRIRKKREAGILGELNGENAFVKENLRVESYVSEDLSYLEDYDLTFWTSVFHQGKNGLLIGTANGDLVLFELQNRIATTVALSLGEAVGYKAKAFSHYDEQWFAILQRRSQGSYISLYTRVGRGIERRQTIVLEGDSDFDLLTVRGVHYLAVATYKIKTNQGYTYQANVVLYHWTRTQFDIIATRITYGVGSLACWSLDGSLYLSVAQETNDEKNLYLGSPVFVYNAKEESSLVKVETLNTKAPRKCAHFFVSGSHYLIFIGEFDAVIYWWAGNQFLEWQTIVRSAGAVDVSVLHLIDGEAIIAIALKDRILFLTLDVSGHYTLTYVKSFEGFSLSSLQFMWDSKDYFALALFEASLQRPPHPTWRLNLITYKLPSEAAMDSLLLCLHRVKDRLEERQTEMQDFSSRIDKVWLLNREQKITGNIIVKGSIISENRPIKADVIQITSTETDLEQWTPTIVNEEIGRLSSTEAVVSSQAQNSLLKTTRQEVSGFKNFTGLVETPSFSVKYLSREFFLNNIQISELLTKTLKTSGNQAFASTLHLKGLAVETAEAASINNLNTSDFLLLHGEQVISGSLDFSDVLATDVLTGPQGTLNSIKIDQIVTRHGDQEIHGLKSFSFLKADVIDVHGHTNGEDLEEISAKIVTVDGGDIYGSLEFRNPIDIEGDILLLGLINKVVNISHLIHEGVNKYSDQDITGPKTFLSTVTVNNFHVAGTVNGIDIDKDLISLSGDQEISGSLTFASHVTFEEDVHADLVNGVDLSTEAVLKHDDQFIEGHKTFMSHLTADEIKMGEGVTLDYVDPSELAKMLVQHENGVINDTVVIDSVVILGDLIAEQGINNLSVKDLPDVMYLKSKPQEIKVPVVFPGRITTENLDVDLVNDLNLDSDVVHTFGDEEILGKKHFVDGINVVNNLNIQKGRLFGGVLVSSFRNEGKTDSTVSGTKILPFLQVKGDVTADLVNGLDLSDLMLVNKPQRISGKHLYKSATVKGDLQVKNAMPKFVNGINFEDFIHNAVSRNPSSSRKISNKTFTEIKASALRVESGGQIAGVLLEEMVSKAVTINTHQEIYADKTFSGSLVLQKETSAARVNDLDLASHIKNVIFLDQKEAIRGKKTIHGDLHASDLTVYNLLNGVNLTEMSEEAVYKSRRNEITVPMVFLSDLDIGSLIVKKPALLDGILLEDLALVDEDTYIHSAEFRTNLFIAGNMNVGGLVNGCNIFKVLNEALKLRGTEQILTSEVEINSLNVSGSVTFRDTVSGVELEDLFKVVTRPEHHVIKGNFHFGSGIEAHSLNLDGPIEGIDLSYIMHDAVRKSLPQEITSIKHFQEDLEIGILESTDGLFVTGTVNNVNLEELTKEVVWKDGFQVINGEKTFSSLHANNATIFGNLNGLKLPEDVVLTYTSDRISGPVHLMKDLVIKSHLTVHGKIDDVDLNTFLNRRVTLNADEVVSAEIVLKDLTVNDIVVDGMINDVALEMAVQSYKNNKIQGIKEFNNLAVHGDLTTGLINGYNLTELLNSLVRLDDRENLHGIQVFTQPLHLTSAVVKNVNGIELEALEKAHLNASNKITAIEKFFDGENKLQQDQIAKQMESALYQISDFAYLVQIQELNFGASNNIIIGHRIRSEGNKFFQYMVMWTTLTTCVTPQKCCDSTFSYWLEADDNGYLTSRNEPEKGRYFPAVGVNLFPTDGNLVVWTETSVAQPTWCSSKIQETTVIASIETSPLTVFLTLKNSALLTDVRAFREGKLYIVAGYYYDKRSGEYSRSVVYDYNDMLREWKEYQLLSAYGVVSMDITSFKTDSSILLALGTGLGSYPDSELFLYKWNYTERKFVEMQRRPSDYVTNILWVDNKNSKLLVVSSVEYWSSSAECAEDISGGQLDVYEYYSSLKWIQSVPLKGIVSVVSFQTGGETFLVAASRQMETIYILRWKGFGGFSVIHSIYSPGVRHLNTYRRRNDLFVTVASASGRSTVLKAIVRGKTYYQRSEEEFPVELNDAPYNLQSSQAVC